MIRPARSARKRRGTRSSPPCTIDVIVESPLWGTRAEAEAWVHRAVLAALPARHGTCAVTVLLTVDRSIRVLNARFRGRDMPTNVLSFPAAPGLPRQAARSKEPVFLGDIAVAVETARAEAAAEGREFIHHVTHLVVHGVLHLLGYDHQSDAEAEAMESREGAILSRLGMPDPHSLPGREQLPSGISAGFSADTANSGEQRSRTRVIRNGVRAGAQNRA